MNDKPESQPTTIIIADDHELVRVGLQTALAKREDFELVAEAEDGQELLQLMQHQPVDIVLLDIDMPGMDGISALKELRHRYSDTKVVMLSMHEENFYFRQSMILGAYGFIIKKESPKTILQYLEQVRKGEIVHSEGFRENMKDLNLGPLSNSPFEALSKRENEILYFVIGGYSNQQIAETLDIALGTVEFHKKNIKEKLEVESNADIIHLAYQYSLV